MNARNTGRRAPRNANADAPAPDAQDQSTQDAPATPDAAPQVDPDTAQPDTDAPQAADAPATAADSATAQAEDDPATPATPDAPETVQPEETDPATPLTESDGPVTESNPDQPDAPAQAETPASPASAPAETPVQMFARMLTAATAVTTSDLNIKLQAFATALVIARTEILRTIAARKDDEIVRTVTLSARPDSSSGRGPTLAKVQGTIAALLGGAGFVSHGNCHDSTKRNPIYGHVTLPEAALPFWNALYQAMDAPAGPFRTAEATTKQVNRASIKAGTAQFRTSYEAENKLSRINMMNTAYNLASLVPPVAADNEVAITAMRDVIAAVTAEFTRVTSVAFIPKGPTYVVAPTDAYAVKADAPAAPPASQFTPDVTGLTTVGVSA